jgi:hypothetical protein
MLISLQVRRPLLVASTAAALSIFLYYVSLFVVNLPWTYMRPYKIIFLGIHDLIPAFKYALVVFAVVVAAVVSTPYVRFRFLWALALAFWFYRLFFRPFELKLMDVRNVQHLLQHAKELPFPFVEWTVMTAPLLLAMMLSGRIHGSGRRMAGVLVVAWLGVHAVALYIIGRYPYGEIDPYPVWESSLAKGVTLLLLVVWPICVVIVALVLLRGSRDVEATGAA